MITSAVYPGISCLILFILNLTIVQLTINYSLYQPWLLLLKTVQVWIMLLELLLVKRAPSFCFYFYEHSDRDCLTELQLWPQIILFNVTKPCHQPSFLNKANGMYPCYSFIWLFISYIWENDFSIFFSFPWCTGQHITTEMYHGSEELSIFQLNITEVAQVMKWWKQSMSNSWIQLKSPHRQYYYNYTKQLFYLEKRKLMQIDSGNYNPGEKVLGHLTFFTCFCMEFAAKLWYTLINTALTRLFSTPHPPPEQRTKLRSLMCAG